MVEAPASRLAPGCSRDPVCRIAAVCLRLCLVPGPPRCPNNDQSHENRAATRSVMFIDSTTVSQLPHSNVGRSVFVGLHSELAHRLTETLGIVPGHLRF